MTRVRGYLSSHQQWPRQIWLNIAISIALRLLWLPNLLWPQTNVLTANYDNSRTNSNLSETILKPSNVSPDTFGKIGSFPVDGQIYAQPLYAANVQIAGKGSYNVVYVVTMHNSVYAIDAGAPQSVLPLWQVNLGASVPSSALDFTDILPEVGILSTPVIDLDRQVIYVVSDTLEQGAPVFRIHALSLSDGHEMLNGPVVITAWVPGFGVATDAGVLPFDASLQLQRPGLALANGTVYVAFGSHADGGDFHGWMIGYDASNLGRRVAVFNTTPNTWGGSFWQAGRAPAIDSAGNILAATGNGDFTGERDFSDSVLKLSGRDLSLMDWFTPDNWADLRDTDQDLGSAGVILLPGSNQLLATGKSGDLMLVEASSMSHLGPMHSLAVESFKIGEGSVFNFAFWNSPDGPFVYVQAPGGPLNAYRITGGHLDPTALSRSGPSTSTIYCGIAVSADNGVPATGIVWQTTANYGVRQVPGTLHAFDAGDLSRELWNSDMVANRDALGRFAKFVAPTVANGRVYVPTFSDQLEIYGLLADAGPANEDLQVTSVVNAASLLSGAISPGEAVTIFGAHIGPSTLFDMQVDATNHAENMLAETQVLFGGLPAPLLYASAGEVGAVVPFGTAGPATEIEVVYRGRKSAPWPVHVVPAAPALFARDGTGGGQGWILNADGSLNSPDNPAERGSIAVIYVTGLGQTSPPGEDGRVTRDLVVPAPVLPITAVIDDHPAEVLDSGAAPGKVQGIFRITVRVPYDVAPEYDLHVIVKAGEYTSPATVTLAAQ